MLSTKKDNEPILAVYRVLGALTQLQKECTGNAFGIMAIRSQVKKDADSPESTLGRLGRGWLPSFTKAIDRMEKARILEYVTAETVAFTPNATLVLSNSPQLLSIPNSSSAEENHYWQELISFSTKRPLEISNRGFSTSKKTSSEISNPNKRARLSEYPIEKVISMKMPKSKPQVELQETTAQVPRLVWINFRPTNLGDNEEEVHDPQLRREGLKDSEEEVVGMRRDLSATGDAAKHRISDDGGNEPDITNNIGSPRTSSQRRALTPESNHFPQGVIRIQSGSFTLNQNKRPTPTPLAPSSPDRQMDVDGMDDNFKDVNVEQPFNNINSLLDQGRTRQSTLPPTLPDEVTHHLYQSPGIDDRAVPAAVSTQSPTPQSTPTGTLPQLPQEVTISTLQTEIQALRRLLHESAAASTNQEAKIAAGEKAISDHSAKLESLIAHRDGTIFALQDANAKLGAEMAVMQQSWKRAENTVARTTQQLQEAMGSVGALKRERGYTLDRLRNLKKMNEDVRGERDALAKELGPLKDREAELEGANRRLECRINDLLQELDSMKRVRGVVGQDKGRRSPIDRSNERHSNDLLHDVTTRGRGNHDHIITHTVSKSKSISKCRTEVKEKDDYSINTIESLGNELKTRDFRVEGLLSLQQLRDMGESADDLSARLAAAAEPTMATTTNDSLSQDDDLMGTEKAAETFGKTLETTAIELVNFEVGQKEPHPAALVAEELEIRGKQEPQIATGLRGKIEALTNALEMEESSNQRLLDELQVTQAPMIELEQSITDTAKNHKAGRAEMSTRLYFQDSPASARRSLEGVNERLEEAGLERIEIRRELAKINADVDKLKIFLDHERREKSRLAAELTRFVGKTQELEEELRYYERSKIADQAMLTSLCQSFTKYKELQSTSLRELEEKFVPAQPSPPTPAMT